MNQIPWSRKLFSFLSIFPCKGDASTKILKKLYIVFNSSLITLLNEWPTWWKPGTYKVYISKSLRVLSVLVIRLWYSVWELLYNTIYIYKWVTGRKKAELYLNRSRHHMLISGKKSLKQSLIDNAGLKLSQTHLHFYPCEHRLKCS